MKGKNILTELAREATAEIAAETTIIRNIEKTPVVYRVKPFWKIMKYAEEKHHDNLWYRFEKFWVGLYNTGEIWEIQGRDIDHQVSYGVDLWYAPNWFFEKREVMEEKFESLRKMAGSLIRQMAGDPVSTIGRMIGESYETGLIIETLDYLLQMVEVLKNEKADKP